ncbi:TcpE family conjugal transfer membrane protein [Nonomuraea sp. PA05]|uniref:TcpE family conjugal transfer membrane protein n=1 Tax=Nonomuraea sp. PA05 TaxID=2604466 RepID=UPI001651F8C7|nr:TcpE family conjugal transfer membrane protein [Nonomuraea sp. PA05]
MDLPTYTNIWRIEKRLYKLYDLRLPMPLPIVWIGVFVGVFVPWSLLLVLVGVPVEMPWHVLFLVPPGIVTWLSTRPVIEGKRLTELLESQLRYLGQPKAWYRLAPGAEPETVTFSGRVWRTGSVRAKAKAPRKTARQSQRKREGQRLTGPRQVRPAVAAAAAAAAQAPVAEPSSSRTGWGTRRGAAPALKGRVRQGAAPPVSGSGPGVVWREEGLSGGAGRRQEPVSLLDEAVGAAGHAVVEPELVRPVREDVPEPVREGVPEPERAGGGDDAAEVRPAPERVDAQSAEDVSAEAVAAREASVPIKTVESRKPAAGKPIDTEALRRLRKLAASADAPAENGGRSEAGGRRGEDEVARDQHRKGQPPRLPQGLLLPGTQRVWPPLNPNAKPVPRPAVQEPGPSDEVPETVADVAEGPVAAEPDAAVAGGDGAAAGGAGGEGVADEREAQVAEAHEHSAPVTHEHSAPVTHEHSAPVTREHSAPEAGEREGVGLSVGEREGGDEPTREGDGRTVGEREAVSARDVPVRGAQTREVASVRDVPVPGAETREAVSARDVPVRGAETREAAGAVPGPRAGEGKVRRIESVVGRDSGGWRRIAQVVVGGGGVRTDGSEIDEARARAVFGGGRRIVVLGCTGGAGQTTTALMLGHTFAQVRDDRVVAVDANTGGGTLTSKIQPETPETLTSLLSGLDRVSGYLTMRGYTTRTASGLEVISADTDAGAEQRLADRSFFSDHRLGESMRLLDRHYKLAVIDPAAALAARLLPYADQLVLVVPASEEAPEAVAMTYEWLDGHGCAELRRRAVMVVNGVSRRSVTDVEQAESVARGRCRAIVRVPWEDDLAPGGAEVVDPGQLRAAGRRAYLALAGVVVAGFAAQTVRAASEEELASDPPGTRIGER